MKNTHARLAKLEAVPTVITLPTTAIEHLDTPTDVLALLDQTIRDTRAGRRGPGPRTNA